jgi:pimeloyl-ACP methyl ester carboxylesterase
VKWAWVVLLLAACAGRQQTVEANAAPVAPIEKSPLLLKLDEELKREGPLPIDQYPALSVLGQRSFLFVSGFLSEVIPGYFKDNSDVVKELGATPFTIFPSSLTSMTDEADAIHFELHEHFKKDHRPIVLVGHSMGGAAALLCMIRNPDLTDDGIVEKVVIIQGAIGGSPLADAFAHGPFTRINGLVSLTREEATRLFTEELTKLRAKATEDEVKKIFTHVFYVRSSASRGVSGELKGSQLFLTMFGSGASDGMMLAESMRLPDGVDLGVLDSDHAGLVVSSFLSSSSVAQRRAFTRALLRELYADRP